MAINYVTQFAPKVSEAFQRESLTDSACGGEFQFTGSKSVKVLAVDTVPLGDYNREGANRYGTPVELGDTFQEMIMGEDKAFTMTIDKGNNADQMNLKGAAEAMKREVSQVVVPYIDKYRLRKWALGAGKGLSYDAGTFASKVMDGIFDANAAMDEAGVPLTDRTLFLPNKYYKALLLSDKVLGVDKLGEQALSKGVVGEIAGMTVKRVPDSYMPEGILFLAKWKNASVDPVKLQEGKIHKDPPGLSGNLLEGRIYHDSFVLFAKCEGIVVGIDAAQYAQPPVVNTATAGKATITCATANSVIKYTVDGSDPRDSDTAQVYSAAITGEAGTVVKAAAHAKDYPWYAGVVSATIQ